MICHLMTKKCKLILSLSPDITPDNALSLELGVALNLKSSDHVGAHIKQNI